MLKLRLTHALMAAGLSCAAPLVLATPAAAAPSTPAATQYYTVKSGDYLTGIAVTLQVSVRDLLTINSLTLDSVIHPGMRLVVPAGGVLPSSDGAGPSQGAAGAGAVYTVVDGDYLSGIALKLKVKLSSLLTLNRLTTSSLIWAGMTLKVPPGGVVPAAPTAPATPAAPSANGLVYSVVAGDTLIGIATRAKVTLRSLLDENNLTTSSLIYPGMRLDVPAGGVLPAAPATPAPAAPAPAAPVPTTPAPTTAPATTAPATAPNAGTVSGKVDAVLAFAMAQQGKPYAFNTAGPDTFDCSGLTLAAFAEVGINLPHYSGFQARYGDAVDWTTTAIKPGDLVFLESYPGSGVINHVGIAVSATQYIHAPRSGEVVRVGNIPTHRVVSVRRLIAD